MRIALIIVGVVVALIALVVVIGLLLSKGHVASRSIEVGKSPEEVFAAIRDVESYPKWRTDVKRVELLSATRFREHGEHDVVTYDVVDEQPPEKLVTRIADKDLGYSGSWTYDIERTPHGTRVTITEIGEVTNPLFRFLSRFVFGHTATIDRYLAALEKRLAT